MNSTQHWLVEGNVLSNQQRWVEAAAAYAEAVRLEPTNADAWQSLGFSQQSANQFTAAQESFERCLALAPGRVDATLRYAFLLNMMGLSGRAIQILRQTLTQSPQLGIAWLVLSHSYQMLGETVAAIAAAREAIVYNQGQPEPPYQLASLLLSSFALDQCETVLTRMLHEHPAYEDAWALLGVCLRNQGRHVESLAALRQSLALVNHPRHHSTYLAGLQYVEDRTPSGLLAAHLEWNQAHGKIPPIDLSIPRELPTKLRLGFVSADFGLHPVGFLSLSALQSLDKRRVEVVCYSDRTLEDDLTPQFRSAADLWRVVKGHSDEQVAEQIRTDRIHILFDLAGHFGERFTLFARKPAPVQITWLGYAGTTGLKAMDYLLADRFHVPSGDEQYYAERVLRMPHGYACYRPPANAPAVGPLPALITGRATFGCLNNPAKYSAKLLDAWGIILRELPTAQLLLKFGGLEQQSVRSRLLGEFQQRGIDPSRLLIEQSSPHLEALDTYNRIDLALDTQPYSGGLTTCEALWMGVPVVTFSGRTFAGRHSTSHLMNAGLGQFVAADWPSYIALAVHWARHPDELAQVRSSLRGQIGKSPLCDATGFAVNLTDLLEKCWMQG